MNLLVTAMTLALLPAAPVEAEQLPPLLPDTIAVAHVRVGELYQTETLALARDLIENAGPDAFATFDKRYGQLPSLTKSITAMIAKPKNGEPQIVLALRLKQPGDLATMLKEWTNLKAEKIGKETMYLDYDLAVALPEKTLFVVGTRSGVKSYLEKRTDDVPALFTAKQLTDLDKWQLTVAINAKELPKQPGMFPPQIAAFEAAQTAVFRLSLGETVRLSAQATFADDDATSAAETALENGLKAARAALADSTKWIKAQVLGDGRPGTAEQLPVALAGLYGLGQHDAYDRQLAAIKPQRTGRQLAASLKLDVPGVQQAAVLSVIMSAAIRTIGTQATHTFEKVGTELQPKK